ncbi:hypothetical protein NKH77_00820 [Streptomyces sp. M19]
MRSRPGFPPVAPNGAPAQGNDPPTGDRVFSCVLVGGNSLVVTCAELLLSHGHRVAALVSPDAAIREWARQQGLTALDFGPRWSTGSPRLTLRPPVQHRQPADAAARTAGPAARTAGELPRRAAAAHAGLHATSWAVLEGESTHGVTWHVMTEGPTRGRPGPAAGRGERAGH